MRKENKKIPQLIKELRRARNISQMKLAEMVGVSYQQIQKYEKGLNRISVERLKQISSALDIPISIFFQPEKTVVSEAMVTYGKMTDDEQLLMQLFRKIKSKKTKNAILEILKILTK